MIPPGKVGVIAASDGAQFDAGRLHGKAIEGHRNFQDAESFIGNGGQKGPQVEILTPCTYGILTQSVPLKGGDPDPAPSLQLGSGWPIFLKPTVDRARIWGYCIS